MSRTKPEQLRHLIQTSKFLLIRAEELVGGDTEYLREEFNLLLDNTAVLLEKMSFEEKLLHVREELHGEKERSE